MDSKKGGLAVESLVLLVTVLFTSAVVFYLVQSGIVSVAGSDSGVTNSDNSQKDFLNVEFIPIAKGGTLALQNFVFCYQRDLGVTSKLCEEDRDLFFVGDEVHFSFEVITSSYLGEIEVLENYRVLGPNNEVLLDVNAREDFEFSISSGESVESVYFYDYFVLDEDDPLGTYTLELVIRNELIGKEVMLRKEILVK